MKKTISNKRQCFWTIVLLIFIPVFAHAAEWTVMIYLDADNDLESFGVDDFLELATIGSDSSINYVIQMDRINGYDTTYDDWTDCKRFYVEKNMTPTRQNAIQSLGEINMGDPDQLANFIQWSMTNYAAQHYALILWDHGDGWRKRSRSKLTRAICWDDTDGDGSGLSMIELKSVLSSLSTKPDLVGFDACLMGMIENAYMLKQAGVSVMVSSEETEPGDGWPYDQIASGLALHPSWTPEALGDWIVDQYYLSYQMDETQSAIDLSKIDPVISALANLATDIQTNWQGDVDSIHQSAQNLRISIDNAVINTKNGNAYRNAGGLSIYYPTSSYFYDSQYDKTDLSKQTSWNEFLSDYFESMTNSWVSDVRMNVLSFYDSDFIDLRHLSTLFESADPDDFVEPEITELTSSTTLTNLSFDLHERAYYKVEILPEHNSMNVSTHGGSGDVDIYMSKDKVPTKDNKDYSSTSHNNDETIFISEPESAVYYIMLYAYNSFDNVTFSVNYGASQCEFVISKNEFQFSNEPAAGAFEVTTDDECHWSIQNDASWIEILDKDSFYSGSHTVQFNILGNSSAITRNGMIYVSQQTVHIIQQGNASSTVLGNNAPVSEIHEEENSYQYFKVNISENKEYLIIRTSDGIGDCDLYVRYNDFPDKNNYDFKSTSMNNDETVFIENPRSGDYYMMLYAYETFSGVTLKASYTIDNSCNSIELKAKIEAQALSIANLKAELEKYKGAEITLSPGWHLLNGSNVYGGYPITNPENCIEAMYQYKDGSYQPVDSVLMPFKGIWVKANKECNWRVGPVQPQ